MALALYRKYRPRTFAEVIGQEHVTEPLSQALRGGRLNHAYLFSGPRGCGKTSSARILARSLNCEHGPTPEPCGTCASCRALATDGAGSIDVIEIDAASHGGVDDARELREKAFFAPAQSRFKIYVIDEAHMVSSAGFNALLKLVEEPPEYVKFIFATTEPEKVLGTIKSRTHHYPFRLIPPKVLRPYLEQLCQAEGVQVEPAVFPLVVRAGGGSARDSLSVLDQLIAGAGPEGVIYARAAALLGVTDSALIDEMCDALAAGDGAAAYATVDRIVGAGHDPRRFAADLLERLRDLIILQRVPDAAPKGLVDGPDDQIERMTAQAQRLGPGTLSRCADIVHDGLVEMRGATAPRLLLELICARLLLPRIDDSTGGLLQRLETLERRHTHAGADVPPAVPTPATGSSPAAAVPPAVPTPATGSSPAPAVPTPAAGAPPAPAVGSPPRPVGTAVSASMDGPAVSDGPRRASPRPAVMPDPATPEPPRPGTTGQGPLDAAAVRRRWPEVVGLVGRKSKKAAAWAREATVHEVDGQTLVLAFRYPFHAQALANEPDLLIESLHEELGERWQIRCEVAGERVGGPAAGPRAAGPARPATAPARPDPAVAPAAPPRSSAGDGAVDGMAPRSAGSADEQEWPEPARPGGAAPPEPAAGTAEEWPATARPGGAGVDATAAAAAGPGGSTTGGGRASGAGVAPAASAVSRPPVTSGARASSAIAAARAAAAGGAQRSAASPRRTAEPDWAGEPPYDPDYDGVPRGGAAPAVVHEGFDPGDEPLDEVIDERTARQSSEEQAVRLLREAFGAERIDEVKSR
ncbi:DNA polymerase III subunit gamma and tau [Salinispora tropica]|uniref:DNA polymerase III subunit gamma/tau n=1 Tax=Salinispora tropica (strain ATCC BAA-916 / DSM 44818 / JCM 13857 / NBRC 105044 / CNB-440) TaxID=369723 RepID=A4X1E8_SALTO|nr:DNA polymerase III subunit gamma and tau [Salinispora tropica]ABP52698.1 DNA polymerase III, subunits gamma and tau [Salinispora tropica CNB-440]